MSGTKLYQKERNRRLLGALSTTLMARIAGVALQVMSLPIAANAMGADGFSAFAILTAVIGWLMMANFGLARAITVRVSYELGNGNIAAAQAYCNTARTWAFWVSISILALVTLIGLSTNIFTALLGNHVAAEEQIFWTMLAVAIIAAVQLNLSIVEAVQLAYQEQKAFGVYATIGTLIAAGMVLMASNFATKPLAFLCVIHIPTLTLRYINSRNFLSNHATLRLNLLGVKMKSVFKLIYDSAAFFLSGPLNNFFCHLYTIIIVGAYAGSTFTSEVAALINAVTLANALFGFLLSPFFGAAPEAWARKDRDWIRRSYFYCLAANLAVSTSILIALGLFGQSIFQLWYQGAIVPPQPMIVSAGVYLVCMGVEMTNFVFLASTDKGTKTASILTAKAIVTAIFTTLYVMVPYLNQELNLFMGLAVINLVMSAIPLGMVCGKTLIFNSSRALQSNRA